MRPPRNISGDEMVERLKKFGYENARQKGSHVRLTTQEKGEHHVSVPRHQTLNIGTFSGIVHDVATHFGMTRDEVLERLFGK